MTVLRLEGIMVSKNAAHLIAFEMLTTAGAADLTVTPGCFAAQDTGNFTACSNAAVRKTLGGGATNVFHLNLTAGEMNGDCVSVSITGTDCIPQTHIIYTESNWTTGKAEFVDISIASRAASSVTSEIAVDTDSILAKLDVATGTRASSADMQTALANISTILSRVDVATSSRLSSSDYADLTEAFLVMDWETITSTVSDRSTLNALRALRNKFAISGTTFTVYEEDDATSAWTGVVTTDATGIPITGMDPT